MNLSHTKYLIYFIVILFTAGCNTHVDKEFNSAQWIAFEKLADSLKIVPGIHGFGNDLGNKGQKKSIVPLFRKEFQLTQDVKKASINICGLGHYELYINGIKIGDSFLSPGWSLYNKRCLYNNYDISKYLKKGDNVIGIIVGNGFFNINRERYRKMVIAFGYPCVIFNIDAELSDGTKQNIVSDKNCKTTPSPITFSSIYGGEDYDARLEQDGWNNIGFNDSQWKNAEIISNTKGKLTLENDYPLKVMQEFFPIKTTNTKSGNTIYDFGQNASGIISIKVRGNRGAKIIIKPDELVNEKGELTQNSGGSPYTLSYILKGDIDEVWQPKFTYYGFRYAEVEIVEPSGVTKKSEVKEIKMLHTRNSMPGIGHFNCSDTLFNKIFELINWSIKSNLASIATDCPHREKLGWLEQTYLMGNSIMYNFNAQKFYEKIVDDIIDSQLDSGLIPDIAPEYVELYDGFRDSPEWGSASVIIPWSIYKWYGEKESLKKAYPTMKKYVNYLQKKSKNYVLDYGLGDWFDLGPNKPSVAQLTPVALTATAIYYHDVVIMAETAKLLGFSAEHDKYKNLSLKIKEAYLKRFYNQENGTVSTGSQTSYALSIYTGLIPQNDYRRVVNNLVTSIEKNGYKLTSGDIGYRFLVNVLNENNRSDILYKMNCRTDVPGYGYQLKKGATSLTESWDALSNASNNHMMLGHLMEWFYSGLAGIKQDENSIGFEKIIIAPNPVGEIKWVTCSFKSPKGTISSNWKINKNIFELNIEIPPGCHAKIILPEKFRKKIITVNETRSKKTLTQSVKLTNFELESGVYQIISK